MSARPGRIAADVVSTVADGAERRSAADYVGFVKELTDTLRAVMPV
jgi:hypothetical protein